MIITCIYIFILSIVILSFINLKLSVAFYISCLILVPYLQIRFAGFTISYNTVTTLLIVVFLYQSIINKKFRLNFQVIIPFLFLFFSLLFLSLLTWGMPWGTQFNYWRVDVMQTCIISFIIWNIALAEPKSLSYFKWALIISVTIAGIYGIFLLKMEGNNPYTSFLSTYYGILDSADEYSHSETRLGFSTASRIQSTMIHPMLWALVLCFSSIIFSIMYLKTKDKKLWILIGLIGFNILISGVRTGIAAITIGFIYFLIRYRKIKLIILTLVILATFTLVIQSDDSLSNLFASITDVSGKNSEMSGSSIPARLEQFQGTINEINGHELTGKGYSWTSYYELLHGTHPTIFSFESLIFMVLCNSGYIGALIWILFFLLLYRLNRKILAIKIDIFLMDTFIIVFAVYAIGTGNYGYLSFFAILYSFLLAYLLKAQKSEKQQHTIRIDKNKTFMTNKKLLISKNE